MMKIIPLHTSLFNYQCTTNLFLFLSPPDLRCTFHHCHIFSVTQPCFPCLFQYIIQITIAVCLFSLFSAFLPVICVSTIFPTGKCSATDSFKGFPTDNALLGVHFIIEHFVFLSFQHLLCHCIRQSGV